MELNSECKSEETEKPNENSSDTTFSKQQDDKNQKLYDNIKSTEKNGIDYDENELKEEKKGSEDSNPVPNDDNDKPNDGSQTADFDESVLELFYSEINSLVGKVEFDNKNIKMDADKIILRLTSQNFSSPYHVLQLKPDATEEDIKQRYYKISLLIHPDKCKNERAPQAFQVLKDAYNDIKKVDIREKYKEVYEDAKKIVYKRHKLKFDITQLELYSMGNDLNLKTLEPEIEKECVNILNKQKERREYAENCIKANIQYEKNIQSNLMNLEKEKLYHQVEWDKTRDLRVNSWKSFQEKMSDKPVKKNITVKKEECNNLGVNNKSIINLQNNRINKRKKMINTTELYKQNWK